MIPKDAQINYINEYGFVKGGSALLSKQTQDVLVSIINSYKDNTIGDSIMERCESIENEIDVITLVTDNVVDKEFKINNDDMWNPLWVHILKDMIRERLILARVQLHLHNIRKDGPLHADAERSHIRLWNVVISLYDEDKALGATVIYPPCATEDNYADYTPNVVTASYGDYFIMDANTLHFRKGSKNKVIGKERQMLVLTFSDGIVRDVDW